MRGIRGATQVEANTVEAMQDGVAEMCRAITEANHLRQEEIVWAIFTVTHDLDADFPARAAREKGGWSKVPMICSQEIPVPGSLPRTIRVLIHVDSGQPSEARHVYLRGARVLRPDLVEAS
jgi:chorismate mutase